MRYESTFRKRAKQLGQELEKMIDAKDMYSERVPYPEASRQVLSERVAWIELQWGSTAS